MPRYIDADKVLETMRSKMDMQELYLPIHFIDFVIDEMPTADVESVRHGRWKKTGDYLSARDFSMHYYFKCSCCNEITIDNGDYCPNCGAKMDGGTNDESIA